MSPAVSDLTSVFGHLARATDPTPDQVDTAVVFASHDLQLAWLLADMMASDRLGSLVLSGNVNRASAVWAAQGTTDARGMEQEIFGRRASISPLRVITEHTAGTDEERAVYSLDLLDDWVKRGHWRRTPVTVIGHPISLLRQTRLLEWAVRERGLNLSIAGGLPLGGWMIDPEDPSHVEATLREVVYFIWGAVQGRWSHERIFDRYGELHRSVLNCLYEARDREVLLQKTEACLRAFDRN